LRSPPSSTLVVMLLLVITGLAFPGPVLGDPPTIIKDPHPDPTIPMIIEEGGQRSFSIEVSDDVNELDLRYKWFVDEGVCQTGTRTFMFKPDYEMAGEHEVTVEMKDGSGGTERVTWFVTIIDKNRKPTLETGSPLNNTSYGPDHKVYFDLVAKDGDGDPLEMWVLDNGKDMKKRHAVGGNGSLVNRFKTTLSIGTHHIEVRISDGNVTMRYFLTISIWQPHRRHIPFIGWIMALNGVMLLCLVLRHLRPWSRIPFL